MVIYILIDISSKILGNLDIICSQWDFQKCFGNLPGREINGSYVLGHSGMP